MAALYIREYTGLGDALSGVDVQLALEPGFDQPALATGGGSLASAAFGPNTRLVRLNTDVVCSVAFGAAPVAVVTAGRLPANATEYFAVTPGHKVAVIVNS